MEITRKTTVHETEIWHKYKNSDLLWFVYCDLKFFFLENQLAWLRGLIEGQSNFFSLTKLEHLNSMHGMSSSAFSLKNFGRWASSIQVISNTYFYCSFVVNDLLVESSAYFQHTSHWQAQVLQKRNTSLQILR